MIIPRQMPHSPKGSLRSFARMLWQGTLIHGGQIHEFESLMARQIGVRHAVAVSSARFGLFVLLQEAGIKQGEEVLLPSLTCPVVPGMVVAAGGTPVFVDSDPRMFTMNPADMEKKISPRARAVIATHLEGMPCDMGAILSIAQRHGLLVIEDCAQALGSSYSGQRCGTFGRAACFSFAFGKQINTMGGGMIVTDDDDLAASLRQKVDRLPAPSLPRIAGRFFLQTVMDLFLRRALFAALVYPAIAGINFLTGKDLISLLFEDAGSVDIQDRYQARYTNFQAALGIAAFSAIEKNNRRRLAHAERLSARLRPEIRTQQGPAGARSAYCYYSILSHGRDRVKTFLLRRGIDTQPSWNRSCARLPLFRAFQRDCPVADRLEEEILYLPIFPSLNENEIRHMADTLNHSLP